jgi:hypothetical protein
MKNRAFVIAALVVVGFWFVAQLVQINTRYKIATNRNKQVSIIMRDIDKLREVIEDDYL